MPVWLPCIIRCRCLAVSCLSVVVVGLAAAPVIATEPSGDASAAEFFEKEIRPLLVARCVECHGANKQSGGLRLDTREAVLRGGDSGPALVAGQPDASLLIAAVRRGEDRQMPPETPLAKPQVAALEHWVRLGAPWPATSKPLEAVKKLDAARTHWAFQPIVDPQPPLPHKNPIDAFIEAQRSAAGLTASPGPWAVGPGPDSRTGQGVCVFTFGYRYFAGSFPGGRVAR